MDKVVRNDLFDARKGYDRGRNVAVMALWQIVKAAVFISTVPYPSGLKVQLLRSFGARVGTGVVIRPRVNIHLPWKLDVGNHCWIGEDSGLLNLERVVLKDHVAIAHRVYIATGNHDYTDSTMAFRNAPTTIERGVWIASCAFVGPGVVIGEHSVICAGSVVTKSTEPWSIVRGNPAQVVGRRTLVK